MIRPQGKSLNGTRYQDRDGLQLYFAEIIEVATFVRDDPDPGKSLNWTRYQDRDGLQLYFAEIIEVATFVRLENMFQEHLSITALIMWLGRSPRRPSLFKFGFRNQQFQAAALNIQLDGIALLHKCQRSSIG